MKIKQFTKYGLTVTLTYDGKYRSEITYDSDRLDNALRVWTLMQKWCLHHESIYKTKVQLEIAGQRDNNKLNREGTQ